MNILQAIGNFFGIGDAGERQKREAVFAKLAAEIGYKKLAVDACVNLIANVVTGCEFLTYENGQRERKNNYYLFNVRPNVNQSAGAFWHKFIAKLLKNNEALAVMQNDQLFVADGWFAEEKALYPTRYNGVTVGDFSFAKAFAENDVLHIKLHDEDIQRVINGIYESYGKLIASAQAIYKRKNALRVVLDKPYASAMDEATRTAEKTLFEKDFKAWFEADNSGAVLPLPKDFKLTDWSKNDRTTSSHTSRDMRALIDDIFEYAAMACHIPVRLLKGDVAELANALDALLILCIKPLAAVIEDEINAKMYSKDEFLARTYMRIDTSKVTLTDVVKLATAADKLFAAGVNTINDNLRLLNREAVDEPWADKRFVTKNYREAETLGTEGGETDEE